MYEEPSILITIKTMIGGDIDSSDFDLDIITAINSAISTLHQLGIESVNQSTSGDFVVTGEDETWDEYLGDYKHLGMVKGYIYQRVRLMFDPPQNSFLVNAIQDQIKETEWRITVAVDSSKKEALQEGN